MFRTRGILLAALLAVAATSVAALEDLSVRITFNSTQTHAAAETAARLGACASATISVPQKVECVKYFIDPAAACNDANTECTTNGVTIVLSALTFTCEGGSYGDSDTDIDPATACPLDDLGFTGFVTSIGELGTCAVADAEPTSNGGYTGTCYTSAYCAATLGSDILNFGAYCPGTGGAATCCGDPISIAPDIFSGGGTLGEPASGSSDAVAAFRTEIDHVVDLNISVSYDIESPSRLKISVEVPYVTAESTVAYGDHEYKMCPSAYLIDFVDPVETPPTEDFSSLRAGASIHPEWTPLTHMITSAINYDQVGKARTSCANLDFTWDPAGVDAAAFKYPGAEDPNTSVNYATTSLKSVDSTVFTLGAPSFQPDGAPMWSGTKKTGEDRFIYETSDHFDIITAYYQCQAYHDSSLKVVQREEEPDGMIINGVTYPVETYSWTMKVCQVGYFGPQCNSHNPGGASLYSKSCKRVPAAFSLNPQMISTATVSPVDSNLVTKSFLHSVRASRADCPSNHERVITVIQLMYFSHDHEIHEKAEHDLNGPADIFEGATAQTNFNVTDGLSYTSVDAFVTAMDDPLVTAVKSQGVYKLERKEFTLATESMVRQKFAIVSKCLNTGRDDVSGTRSKPDAFIEAHQDGGTIFFDFELLLERSESAETQINTVNMRVLATKETFRLPSEYKLQQATMTATQYLYGSFKEASEDVALAKALNNDTEAGVERRPGDQVCSKHQLDESYSTAANLEPNAVGACMLHKDLVSNGVDAADIALAGKTIRYAVDGVPGVQTFTYGCRIDPANHWIKSSTSYTEVDGVYKFSAEPARYDISLTHEKVYWVVTTGKLNKVALSSEYTMAKRFGVGLFFFDSTTKLDVSDENAQMQRDEGYTEIVPGCRNTVGHMKSSCNLVCFDLARNLLSDPGDEDERQVVVHHISVATVVNEEQGAAGSRSSRKLLMETAAATGGESSGTTALTVGPAHATATPAHGETTVAGAASEGTSLLELPSATTGAGDNTTSPPPPANVTIETAHPPPPPFVTKSEFKDLGTVFWVVFSLGTLLIIIFGVLGWTQKPRAGLMQRPLGY